MLLKKSAKEKEAQKINIDAMLFFINAPIDRVARPKNMPRNIGIPISAKGIRYLKFSSYVNE